MLMMTRNEAIGFETMKEGMQWDRYGWETLPEWLEHVERIPKGSMGNPVLRTPNLDRIAARWPRVRTWMRCWCTTGPRRPAALGELVADLSAPVRCPFHSTSFVTERTAAFIGQAARVDAPWFFWCSFPDPHHAMTPPGD